MIDWISIVKKTTTLILPSNFPNKQIDNSYENWHEHINWTQH